VHLERARVHMAAGNAAAAYDCYQKAVDISPRLAKQFIEVFPTCIILLRSHSFSPQCRQILNNHSLSHSIKNHGKHAILGQALKTESVEFIVAPYEADAQLAFLALNGHVHAVITEDSDLLAYGCPRVSLCWLLVCMSRIFSTQF
jgi:exonuclease 1